MARGRHATRTWPKVSEHSRTSNVAGGDFIDARPNVTKKKHTHTHTHTHMHRNAKQMVTICQEEAKKDEVLGYKRMEKN